MAREKREDKRDSTEYLARREGFRRLMTVCGRKPVLEALARDDVDVVRLHVAKGARGDIIKEILALAKRRGVEVSVATPERVSQISRNRRQDQGVAADLRIPRYGLAGDYLSSAPPTFALLALDGVTTPRNVGLVVRSVGAAGMDGLVLPEHGCCGIIPLMVKASAGSVFRTRILRCETLLPVLEQCIGLGAEVCTLDPHASESLFDYEPHEREVYVLGGEAGGVSCDIRSLSTRTLRIPMANGIESLNVAVAAALAAYHRLLSKT